MNYASVDPLANSILTLNGMVRSSQKSMCSLSTNRKSSMLFSHSGCNTNLKYATYTLINSRWFNVLNRRNNSNKSFNWTNFVIALIFVLERKLRYWSVEGFVVFFFIWGEKSKFLTSDRNFRDWKLKDWELTQQYRWMFLKTFQIHHFDGLIVDTLNQRKYLDSLLLSENPKKSIFCIFFIKSLIFWQTYRFVTHKFVYSSNLTVETTKYCKEKGNY